MVSDYKLYYVLLNNVQGLGPRRQSLLIRKLGSPAQVLSAKETTLRSIEGIPPKVIDDLLEKRKTFNPEKIIEELSNKEIAIVHLEDPVYPKMLKEIHDPPPILYIKGNVEVLQKPMFAIVGARNCTYYGKAVTEKISMELTQAGFCIVSGMARGIDTQAHKGSLAAGGPTVAVLGCGVDVIYPKENRKLMAEIIERGAVISEFPPGMKPVPGNFPQRNRLISGLSKGVLVVEAAEKSGSLITADFALEQGREVFAVPGQITNPINKGAHNLIKQGAGLVEKTEDILAEFGYICCKGKKDYNQNEKIKGLTPLEKKVYNIISDTPLDCESIIQKTKLGASDVLSMLLFLEMEGIIRQLPGQRYVRCL